MADNSIFYKNYSFHREQESGLFDIIYPINKDGKTIKKNRQSVVNGTACLLTQVLLNKVIFLKNVYQVTT